MNKDDFNMLHPSLSERTRGWKPVRELNAKARPTTSYSEKHIFILADQLFYDIDAVTSLVDKATRGTEGAPTTATSESDIYRPMFYRWFDQYIAKIESILKAFVAKPARVANINGLREWNEREIALLMPDYWDDTAYDALVAAIHRYVTTGALYEYFALTLTSRDPRTVDKFQQLDDIYDDICASAFAVKPGSIHRSLKPF